MKRGLRENNQAGRQQPPALFWLDIHHYFLTTT